MKENYCKRIKFDVNSGFFVIVKSRSKYLLLEVGFCIVVKWING